MASDNLAAALDAVANETSESPADETKEAEVTSTEDTSSGEKAQPKASKPGAESRIQELVAASKAANAELDEVKSKLADRDSELQKLVDLLEVRERDSQIVNRINQLHADPKYTDMIERLDKAVQGIDEALDETQDTEDKDKTPVSAGEAKELQKMRDELSNTREELAEQLADQQAEMLLNQADNIIAETLSQLPESDYTEDDMKVISAVLDDKIDWEAIEENPNDMATIITKGVQEVVDWYGEPRGKLATAQANKSKAEAEGPSLEEIIDKDWGKMKEVTSSDGKTRKVPTLSDDEFSKVLGEALRRSQ